MLNFVQIGYADGIAEGKDSVFQKGFDLGYKDGLRTSFEIEKFRHFFKNINMDKLSDDDSRCLQNEIKAFNKLRIKESKSPDHFQYKKYTAEKIDYISERQHEYVHKIMEQYKNEMPKVSALLEAQRSTNCI